MMFAKPAMNVIPASASKQSDSCGVRTHALAGWRLKPAPQPIRPKVLKFMNP